MTSLAACALVTCVVFWTGFPFVLGMCAISAGLRADRRLPAAAGALAIVLAAVGCFVG